MLMSVRVSQSQSESVRVRAIILNKLCKLPPGRTGLPWEDILIKFRPRNLLQQPTSSTGLELNRNLILKIEIWSIIMATFHQ